MSETNGSFWTTLPGILTGFASVIAAVTGLVVALNGGDPTADAKVGNPGEVVVTSDAVKGAPSLPALQLHADNAPVAANEKAQTVAAPAQSFVAATGPTEFNVKPLPQVVDCSSDKMLNNTVPSLMSWSKHYFDEAQAHQGSDSQRYDCEKLLQYRASAWCKEPSPKIRNALMESLRLCRVNGTLVAWYQSK